MKWYSPVVNLFRRSKPDPDTVVAVTRLEHAVTGLESALRTLEAEQIAMHDQVRRWMRRAVAAERSAERGRVDAPEPEQPPVRQLWGARARIAARRRAPPVRFAGDALMRNAEGTYPMDNGADRNEPDGEPLPEGGDNGLHS